MISDRQQALDKIRKVLSIDQLQIQHSQTIGDLSLNIHGENYFRDVFNRVYDRDYVNANQNNANEPYIDLIDHSKKEFVQITTTRTKKKIGNTLKIFKSQGYSGYKLYIYYLLEKSKPDATTVEEFKKQYGIDITDCVKDSTDLFKDISGLRTDYLIDLANTFFSDHAKKYTDKVVLDLVIRQLLREMPKVNPSYDESLTSLEVDKKIQLNQLNGRISSEISTALDYVFILEELDEGNLSSELKALVVEDIYRKKLMNSLKSKVSKQEMEGLNAVELHEVAEINGVNFNKPIKELADSIKAHLHVEDFNAMKIGWIIVAHYFELCDVGIK